MSNDKILHVFGPGHNNQELDESTTTYGEPVTSPDWQDTLKFSNGITGLTHRVYSVYGGTEDTADFNNGASYIRLIADRLWAQGKYVFTIKGGCRDIYVAGTIWRGGTEVDVDIGGWSDQQSRRTVGTTLSLKKGDGSPVTVRVLNADKPTLVPGSGPYRYVFPHPDAWYHHICVRFFMVFHKFFK